MLFLLYVLGMVIGAASFCWSAKELWAKPRRPDMARDTPGNQGRRTVSRLRHSVLHNSP